MHTAQDRRQRETSCQYRINKQQRWLSKKRTKRQTKNLFDSVKLQIKQTSCGSANSFEQGLHETALDCLAHLAEKLTDQPVLKVDEYFEEQIPEAELGRSKKYRCSTKQEVEALM